MEISFEFFPPKTKSGLSSLKKTWQTLNQFQPSYYSVTFGAGGSTRDTTLQTVTKMCEAGLSVAPHISGICATKTEIDALLTIYQSIGVTKLVVLRGDIPSGMGIGGGYFQYAKDLVEYIRASTGNTFDIEVGCYPEVHPQAKSSVRDFQAFKDKVNAGANGAITQFFFHPDAYYYFIDSCNKAGLTIPVTPGIMPIYDIDRLQRFAGVCGAEIPLWLVKKIDRYQGDQRSIEAFSIDFMTRFCQQLIEIGVPGLHFYTLNKSSLVVKILENLGVKV